jgi:hypothetical protein
MLVSSRQRTELHLQRVCQATRGVVFLGTPHQGSSLAPWAEALAKSIGVLKQTNTKILAVLRKDSEVLARIQDSFHALVRDRSQYNPPSIEISCFYEELPVPGVGSVSDFQFWCIIWLSSIAAATVCLRYTTADLSCRLLLLNPLLSQVILLLESTETI